MLAVNTKPSPVSTPSSALSAELQALLAKSRSESAATLGAEYDQVLSMQPPAIRNACADALWQSVPASVYYALMQAVLVAELRRVDASTALRTNSFAQALMVQLASRTFAYDWLELFTAHRHLPVALIQQVYQRILINDDAFLALIGCFQTLSQCYPVETPPGAYITNAAHSFLFNVLQALLTQSLPDQLGEVENEVILLSKSALQHPLLIAIIAWRLNNCQGIMPSLKQYTAGIELFAKLNLASAGEVSRFIQSFMIWQQRLTTVYDQIPSELHALLKPFIEALRLPSYLIPPPFKKDITLKSKALRPAAEVIQQLEAFAQRYPACQALCQKIVGEYREYVEAWQIIADSAKAYADKPGIIYHERLGTRMVNQDMLNTLLCQTSNKHLANAEKISTYQGICFKRAPQGFTLKHALEQLKVLLTGENLNPSILLHVETPELREQVSATYVTVSKTFRALLQDSVDTLIDWQGSSFTAALIEHLLVQPRYQLTDLIWQNTEQGMALTGVDLHHAFEAPLAWVNNRPQLKIKSPLYYLPAMHHPVHADCRAYLLAEHPLFHVLNWVKGLHALPIKLQLHVLPRLYQQLVLIQQVLLHNPQASHWDLLTVTHPLLARYVQTVLAEYPATKAIQRLFDKSQPALEDTLHALQNWLPHEEVLPHTTGQSVTQAFALYQPLEANASHTHLTPAKALEAFIHDFDFSLIPPAIAQTAISRLFDQGQCMTHLRLYRHPGLTESQWRQFKTHMPALQSLSLEQTLVNEAALAGFAHPQAALILDNSACEQLGTQGALRLGQGLPALGLAIGGSHSPVVLKKANPSSLFGWSKKLSAAKQAILVHWLKTQHPEQFTGEVPAARAPVTFFFAPMAPITTETAQSTHEADVTATELRQ